METETGRSEVIMKAKRLDRKRKEEALISSKTLLVGYDHPHPSWYATTRPPNPSSNAYVSG